MKIQENVPEKKFGYGVRHIQVVCMCLTMLALFLARSSMAVAVLAMTDTGRNDTGVTVYEWDKQTQGYILSSFFWGYVAMQLPAGMLSKRYGGKPVMLVALLINSAICGLLPSLVAVGGWPVVCACRVVMGLTQACTFPATHTLLGGWLPAHERTSISGVIYAGGHLGVIIAMPVSGLLAETALGWRSIFYAVSAITGGVAALWYCFAASSPREHRLMTEEERSYIERDLHISEKGSAHIPWRRILSTRSLWAVVVTHIGGSCSYILFFVDMPTYLERGLQISLKNSAFLSALPYIGMMTGGLVSSNVSELLLNRGYLSLSLSRKIFNSIGYIGMALGLVALSFIGPAQREWAVLTLVAALTFNGFYTSGFMMVYLDMSPNYAGVMLSLTNFVSNIGSILTPILTSLILNNDPTNMAGWRVVFLLMAGLCVITNFAFVLFVKTHRREWDDPKYLDKRRSDPEEMKPALSATKEEEAAH
ncbi:putative inorganic phosphate cotransporter [Aricia agestis]|uniref:putative inorganic phosphate cotransporter n=1 Tax=Aricia agestis TaxID=91739 RepID=UPI001C201C8C|nr:putative inorganic phosphate cotransporter [Aricia agestis]